MDSRYTGQQIRRLRTTRGKTLDWLAEQAELSTSFVGHLERGTRVASVDTLMKICLALDASLDALVFRPRANLALAGYAKEQLAQAQKLLEIALMMSDAGD